VVCELSLSQIIQEYEKISLSDKFTAELTLKVAIASGAARRFVIGDATMQSMEVLAGVTVTSQRRANILLRKTMY
jgi:hypothetical protein